MKANKLNEALESLKKLDIPVTVLTELTDYEVKKGDESYNHIALIQRVNNTTLRTYETRVDVQLYSDEGFKQIKDNFVIMGYTSAVLIHKSEASIGDGNNDSSNAEIVEELKNLKIYSNTLKSTIDTKNKEIESLKNLLKNNSNDVITTRKALFLRPFSKELNYTVSITDTKLDKIARINIFTAKKEDVKFVADSILDAKEPLSIKEMQKRIARAIWSPKLDDKKFITFAKEVYGSTIQ